MEFSSPSCSTVMLWMKKIGKAQLELPKERADDWILVVDESIGIGQEKVLVILAIRRSDIDFTRPLMLQDMKPITVKSKQRWTGQDIANELNIAKKMLGTVIYAVTDAGSTLKCGLKEAGIRQVYDITHAIAIILQRLYEKDETFKDYTHKAAQMRFKLCCSKNAHLIPPNQRSKSRFLNIDTISKWGMVVLDALQNNDISLEERGQLQWGKEMEAFVVEMDSIISIVRNISTVLKHEGLSKQTKLKCISMLSGCRKGRLKEFKVYMLNYLDEHTKEIKHQKETILCCSDIIESAFGRYKNELSKNPMSGITDLVLIIPALTAKLTEDFITNAIDSCTVKDIVSWKKENLCNSLLAKRKNTFKTKGRENKNSNSEI